MDGFDADASEVGKLVARLADALVKWRQPRRDADLKNVVET